MAIRTVQHLLELLEKSTLLTDVQMSSLRDEAASNDVAVVEFATSLVRRKVISRWQAEQLLVGRSQFTLDEYRVIQRIGSGGMGKVYLAEAVDTGKMFAIKILSKRSLEKPDLVARFKREMQVAMSLDHPNIVRAFTSGSVRGQHYLVMEFVNGRNLNEWLDEFERLPIPWACECVRQAAIGLQYAHEAGLVHRDVKPSNILVVDDAEDGPPHVKLTDMGLARMDQVADDESELTRTGEIVGTVDYIAPEQAQSTKQADIRADIYSLGCTLFKLLAGQVPFAGGTTMERLMARISKSAPNITEFRDDVPDQLAQIIGCMLDRDRERRFQTPAEVADALKRFTSNSRDKWDEESTLRLPIPSADVADLHVPEDGTVRDFFADVGLSENMQRAERVRRHRRVSIAVAAVALLVGGVMWFFFSDTIASYLHSWGNYLDSLGNE